LFSYITIPFLFAIFLIVDYARDRILRVYAHGSPPIATVVNTTIVKSEDENIECPILEAFGLPVSMVYAYIQPYDPVVRLFSGHDVLYPLVDDLGTDGITLYSTVSTSVYIRVVFGHFVLGWIACIYRSILLLFIDYSFFNVSTYRVQ
jgi:hypothetical protein